MTAQEDGLQRIGVQLRRMVPPELEYIVVVFPSERIEPRRIAFVTSLPADQSIAACVTAAEAFIQVARNEFPAK